MKKMQLHEQSAFVYYTVQRADATSKWVQTMVKQFLIDGYNVAHKLGINITKQTLQQVRNSLQQRVSRYMTQKRCKATLVFDGCGVLDRVESYPNLTVVFTASGESADARIKRIIDETPGKASLCVVSSDNEILRYAQVSRTKTMCAETFLLQLNGTTKPLMPKQASDADTKPDSADLGDFETWKKLFERQQE